jgi:hypothetical protein
LSVYQYHSCCYMLFDLLCHDFCLAVKLNVDKTNNIYIIGFVLYLI